MKTDAPFLKIFLTFLQILRKQSLALNTPAYRAQVSAIVRRHGPAFKPTSFSACELCHYELC